MKHLHFQGIGGASGDMLLAALLDLGVPRRVLQESLAKLDIDAFRLRVSRRRDLVPPGLNVEVTTHHEHHHHDHNDHEHEHKHEHRGLREIKAIIKQSGLPTQVQEQSLEVFNRLAHAEAHVHGSAPEKVHFHEVGAVDAIVDIVGVCIAIHHLGISQISAAPLPLGRGVVKCAHGLLPLPAPATIELLKGFPVETVDETLETVTPTGAALLTALRTMDKPPAGAKIIRTGAGYGRHKLKTRPNVLRAFLLESAEPPAACPDACVVLECQLDDCPPEWVGDLLPRLLATGALDAYTTPIFMKKQRPAILLTTLAPLEKAAALRDLIFRETTTFGIRSHLVDRMKLSRRTETAETPLGSVKVKIGAWQGYDVTRSPEYESCAELARKTGTPLKDIYEAAIRAQSKAVKTPDTVKKQSQTKAQPARAKHSHPHGHPHSHGHHHTH